MNAPPRTPILATLAAALAVAGCASTGEQAIRPERSSHGSLIITAEQIARTNAQDAWEVLRFSGAPVMLLDRGNRGQSRIQRRGVGSIMLNDGLIVMVDGARMSDPDGLRNVNAVTIDTMEIMTGSRATQLYGTGAAGGAIVVRTRIFVAGGEGT